MGAVGSRDGCSGRQLAVGMTKNGLEGRQGEPSGC
eukprot:SAG31_NODE_5300_length_2622_cov_40.288942_2_plen_35_part_00